MTHHRHDSVGLAGAAPSSLPSNLTAIYLKALMSRHAAILGLGFHAFVCYHFNVPPSVKSQLNLANGRQFHS